MKKGSTLFLRSVIILIGLAVLAAAVLAVPLEIWKDEWSGAYLPFWVILYLTIIPFYFALYQGLKLLGFIDKNTAFSENSVKALRTIKFCALAMTALYWVCMPWVFRAAELDDAPGLILIWAAFSCSPIVIAVFAALLETLLQNVIDIKSENDLTV